jgi:hypothetical protein
VGVTRSTRTWEVRCNLIQARLCVNPSPYEQFSSLRPQSKSGLLLSGTYEEWNSFKDSRDVVVPLRPFRIKNGARVVALAPRESSSFARTGIKVVRLLPAEREPHRDDFQLLL